MWNARLILGDGRKLAVFGYADDASDTERTAFSRRTRELKSKGWLAKLAPSVYQLLHEPTRQEKKTLKAASHVQGFTDASILAGCLNGVSQRSKPMPNGKLPGESGKLSKQQERATAAYCKMWGGKATAANGAEFWIRLNHEDFGMGQSAIKAALRILADRNWIVKRHNHTYQLLHRPSRSMLAAAIELEPIAHSRPSALEPEAHSLYENMWRSRMLAADGRILWVSRRYEWMPDDAQLRSKLFAMMQRLGLVEQVGQSVWLLKRELQLADDKPLRKPTAAQPSADLTADGMYSRMWADRAVGHDGMAVWVRINKDNAGMREQAAHIALQVLKDRGWISQLVPGAYQLHHQL